MTARSGRRLVAAGAAALLAAGCADFTGGTDPTHGLSDIAVSAPVFSVDVQPILQRRCATGGCHSPLTHQSGLILTADTAYGALVGRASRLKANAVIVRPGDPAGSWLLDMVGPDQAKRGLISRMPLGSGPLTPNQIATISNWIARGAPRQ